MQITSVRSLITIFVTETLMKEYDIDRDLWLVAYFHVGKLTETVVPYVFPSIHIYFFWKKKTARAEAFQPGHLTWRALASRRHCQPELDATRWASPLSTGLAADHIIGLTRVTYAVLQLIQEVWRRSVICVGSSTPVPIIDTWQINSSDGHWFISRWYGE